MRHCRRADFVILDFLLEIIHGDIGPKITIQIDEYGIDSCRHHTGQPSDRNAQFAWWERSDAVPGCFQQIALQMLSNQFGDMPLDGH